MDESIHFGFLTTSDGYRIAYSQSGEGRPLLVVPEPVSHLGIYRSAEGYMRHWFEALESRFRLVLYDGRGQGMSGRGLKPEHSVEDEARDLEAVVNKVGLGRFTLVTRSPSGVHYALRHPEKIDTLIIQAMPAVGSSWPTAWTVGLASENWDLFLEMLVGVPAPDAVDRARGIQRLKQVTTQADWLVRMRLLARTDVTKDLCAIRVPCLVLHPRDYHIISPQESMRVAALVPGARLVLIDGTTSRGDPAQCAAVIDGFLAEQPAHPVRQLIEISEVMLSMRQQEVLRLIAEGKTTREIADRLVLSERTVERHIADVYAKIGARNRSEATAFALGRLAVRNDSITAR